MNMLCLPVGPLQANCYLVWDNERRACAVDPGGEPHRVAATLARDNLALQAILVTHGHFDHLEGVAGLVAATHARVYCSPAVLPRPAGRPGLLSHRFPLT